MSVISGWADDNERLNGTLFTNEKVRASRGAQTQDRQIGRPALNILSYWGSDRSQGPPITVRIVLEITDLYSSFFEMFTYK